MIASRSKKQKNAAREQTGPKSSAKVTTVTQCPRSKKETLMTDTETSEITAHTLETLTQCESLLSYDRFKINAVVDWVELRIELRNPSNFDTLRRRLGVPQVTPLDKGPGGAATAFTFKIQDPASWRSVREQLEKLTHDHPLAKPPEVIGIEVALDAYSKANDMAELQGMAKHFYRQAACMVSDVRRAAKNFKGSGKALLTEQDVVRALEQDFNIYIGNKGAAERLHIYVKTTDNGGKPLPVGEYRARMEITLSGDELPFTSLEEGEAFDMKELSRYFKFRRQKEGVNPFVAEGLKGVAQVGERKPRAHPDRRARFFSSSGVADTALNAKAYDSLRRLTKKLRR